MEQNIIVLASADLSDWFYGIFLEPILGSIMNKMIKISKKGCGWK